MLADNFGLFIGWVGSLCFSLSALPQVYRCFKQGHGEGLSQGMLWLWFVGESCMIYRAVEMNYESLLITNYLINLACLLIILRYKYLPTKETKEGQ